MSNWLFKRGSCSKLTYSLFYTSKILTICLLFYSEKLLILSECIIIKRDTNIDNEGDFGLQDTTINCSQIITFIPYHK